MLTLPNRAAVRGDAFDTKSSGVRVCGQKTQRWRPTAVGDESPEVPGSTAPSTAKPPWNVALTSAPTCSSTVTPNTACWSSGYSISTAYGRPGWAPAITIPSQEGSSTERAGGRRSIGPAGCDSSAECPIDNSPVRRGTTALTLGSRGIAAVESDILGSVSAGIGTWGMATVAGRPIPGRRRRRSIRRGLAGSSS